MIEENRFVALLANMLAADKVEAKRLQESNGFKQMISDYQPPVREDGFISIQHYAMQRYVREAGLRIEDEKWDHILFQEWMSNHGSSEVDGPPRSSSSPWAEMLDEDQCAAKDW